MAEKYIRLELSVMHALRGTACTRTSRHYNVQLNGKMKILYRYERLDLGGKLDEGGNPPADPTRYTIDVATGASSLTESRRRQLSFNSRNKHFVFRLKYSHILLYGGSWSLCIICALPRANICV